MIVKNWMIRAGLWNSHGLTSTEKLVALCLVQHRNETTNECVVAQRLIAKRTELSLRTVATTLAGLESKMLVARRPARDDFCQYDFWLPAFYVNSVQPLHTPPCRKPINFADDDGCITAWEAIKPKVDDYPPEDEIAKNEFDELVRFCRSLSKPAPIKPWALNTDVLRWGGLPEPTPDPADLPAAEWARHEMMAELFMGEDKANSGGDRRDQ